MNRLIPLVAAASMVLIAACGEQAKEPGTNATMVNIGTAAAKPRASLPTKPPATREAALKLMHDRHENMESIRDAMRASGQTLKTPRPDLRVVRRSAATIAALAPQMPSWFPPGTGPDVGNTDAKAEIWQKPADFAAKAHAFNQVAQAFNAAAKAGNMNAIKARAADLTKGCKACHDPYREED